MKRSLILSVAILMLLSFSVTREAWSGQNSNNLKHNTNSAALSSSNHNIKTTTQLSSNSSQISNKKTQSTSHLPDTSTNPNIEWNLNKLKKDRATFVADKAEVQTYKAAVKQDVAEIQANKENIEKYENKIINNASNPGKVTWVAKKLAAEQQDLAVNKASLAENKADLTEARQDRAEDKTDIQKAQDSINNRKVIINQYYNENIALKTEQK